MGFILSKIIEFLTKSRNNFKILILGMQNAGKTSVLYRLSLGQIIKTNPTIGANLEEFTYNNVKFQAWDLGGQESIRSIWDAYYMNTDAIIYVIDSKNEENLEESREQFHKVLKNQSLKNCIILFLANKQDLSGSKSVNQIIQDYQLDKIKEHIWHIQACSALKGEGLITGIKWLSEQLVFRGKNNFPVNPYINTDNNETEIKNSNEDKDISLTIANIKDNKNEIININKDIQKDNININNSIKNINS